ncbi:alpha/beta hydrolase-fold protein [Brevibacterium sp.]|uniref:alpha/beta hydrolase n=1 Tax=Brevibacterium sp. TaxID=1701 RepID=UPI0025B7B4F7|nr:alpha/beta hydrolase-fold protein [Brevibacterium sp.]
MVRPELTDRVPGGFGSRIAQLETEYFEVESPTIGGRLGISVSLPSGYDPDWPAIPVVYALDAQWQGGLYEKMHRGLTGPEGMRAVAPFLQVNIGYVDEQIDALALRNRDLVPPGEPMPDFMRDYIGETFASEELAHQFAVLMENPHADRFLDFLEGELHPHIREHYAVGDEGAGVFGFSYGGLFALYASTHARTLTRFGAASPGILVPDSTVFDAYREFAARAGDSGVREQTVLLTLGTGEVFGPLPMYHQLAVENIRFFSLVRSRPVPGYSLTAQIVQGEDHETGCVDAYRLFARTCYPRTA